MFGIRLTVPMALGNGDRKQHEQLATVEGCEPAELFAAASELVGCDLAQLPGLVTPEEGVKATEIVTLLRNAQICVIVDLTPAPDKESDESDDEPEDPSVTNTEGPSQPPTQPKPRKSRKK